MASGRVIWATIFWGFAPMESEFCWAPSSLIAAAFINRFYLGRSVLEKFLSDHSRNPFLE
jgi:hypothetical protein